MIEVLGPLPPANGGRGWPGEKTEMAGADGVVRFRILGPLEVWPGEGWSGIGAPKWRALLAALLLDPGQVVCTDRLIDELWGDGPPDRGSNLVSVYVLRLRRVLGDPEGRLLTTRAPGYRLLLGPGELDAGDFEALAGQGREALAAGDSPRAAGVLAEALGLWRGPGPPPPPPPPPLTAPARPLGGGPAGRRRAAGCGPPPPARRPP